MLGMPEPAQQLNPCQTMNGVATGEHKDLPLSLSHTHTYTHIHTHTHTYTHINEHIESHMYIQS